MNILFKLAHVFGAECVGYGFSLPCVLCSVAGIEETALDGDESVVVIRFQESRPMSIDYRYRFRVCNTDMVRLNAQELAILVV